MLGEQTPRKQTWGEYFFKKGAKLLAKQFEQPVKELLKNADWQVSVGNRQVNLNSGKGRGPVGGKSSQRRKSVSGKTNFHREF